ncbi:MAG: TOBE domain-containing protein [Chthoniobacterales bacterium]
MGYRNILELSLEQVEERRALLAGPGIQLEGVAQERLTSHRAVVAIRPDDILVSTAQTSSNQLNPRNVIVGQAEIVEYCVRDYLVDISTEAGFFLHARTARRIAPGERVRLEVPTERVLAFSP